MTPQLSEQSKDNEAGSPLPVKAREIFALIGLVALADFSIFRAEGYAGPAALFSVAPLLLYCGSPLRRGGAALPIFFLALLLLATSLFWCGNSGQIVCGVALLSAFAMALTGMTPDVIDSGLYAGLAVIGGAGPFWQYLRSLDRLPCTPSRSILLRFGLPAAVVVFFTLLFLLANPDEARAFGNWVSLQSSTLWQSLREFLPSGVEYVFWIGTAIVASGLLRPRMTLSVLGPDDVEIENVAPPVEISMVTAYRNTLVAVIVLFAAYLLFEFGTLWGRTFPKGFYYAGYAHEGAAWLTTALALATAVLSLIFRGRFLKAPQIRHLKRLAWIWSAENLLLAIAVYHRLLIYVTFNGMTRMRTIGFLGITAVIVGFLLVVARIACCRGFVWLIRWQLWTVAAAAFLYVVLPVDLLIHTYNVRRVLAGDLAPVVQISVHPIDSGGLLALRPLLQCDDEIIRDGIGALLAERESRSAHPTHSSEARHWTRFQLAERLYWRPMAHAPLSESLHSSPEERDAARERFRQYAYQWY